MKDKNFKNVILWITYAFFLLLIILNFKTVWSVFKTILGVLNPVLYGFILAFLLNMPYKFFYNKLFKKIGEKRKFLKKFKMPLSIVCTYLLVIGLITALIAVLIPELGKSIEMLINSLPEYGRQAEEMLDSLLVFLEDKFNIVISEQNTIESLFNNMLKAITTGDVSKFIENITSSILPSAVTTVKSFIGEVYNWLVAVIISVYLIINKEKLQSQCKRLVMAYCKPKTQARLFKVTDLVNNKCGKFIIGKILDSFIIGVICFVCMSIFKFDYALLISFVIGITNIIPVFGPFIGAIPSAFLLLIINPIECLWFILFIIVLQQLDGNLIGPKILGNQIGISSFWIMFSVIIGGGLFGVLGMILSVPIFAVIYTMLGEDVNSRLRKNKVAVSADSGDMPEKSSEEAEQ